MSHAQSGDPSYLILGQPVWGAGSGRYTTTAICALDVAARIQVAASNTTDLVLDVVGYYR